MMGNGVQFNLPNARPNAAYLSENDVEKLRILDGTCAKTRRMLSEGNASATMPAVAITERERSKEFVEAALGLSKIKRSYNDKAARRNHMSSTKHTAFNPDNRNSKARSASPSRNSNGYKGLFKIQPGAKTNEKKIRLGRSSIHAWGVFAKEQIEQGEIVVEYVGEVIRSVVSDVREKVYSSEMACDYMFKTHGGETIIDATRRGSISRFINHSCEPNCVSEPYQDQVYIVAKRMIPAGEELVYDYLLSEGGPRIPCYCGAKHCKKFMN